MLGAYGETGFQKMPVWRSKYELPSPPPPPLSVRVEILRRLCFIADTVPVKIRKSASHIGGVDPCEALNLYSSALLPHVADPGNIVYDAVVERLLNLATKEDEVHVSKWGLDSLRWLSVEKRGDVVECALAAATAAADCENGAARNSWSTLRGGACGEGDRVTAFLVRAVRFEMKQQL